MAIKDMAINCSERTKVLNLDFCIKGDILIAVVFPEEPPEGFPEGIPPLLWCGDGVGNESGLLPGPDGPGPGWSHGLFPS